MKKFNIDWKLLYTIQQLYAKVASTVLAQGTIGECFHTLVGVCKGCLLSPTLFNIFLQQIMSDALEAHTSTVSTGGRKITNPCFADDIDGLTGNEEELTK